MQGDLKRKQIYDQLLLNYASVIMHFMHTGLEIKPTHVSELLQVNY